MKLLILRGSSQYVNPAYYNVQEIGLSKALARRGWSVKIISSGSIEQSLSPVNDVEWIECKRVGLSKNLGWPKGALGHIREFHPDIIQVQDILTPSTLLAVKAKVCEGVPMVLSMGEYPDGRRTRAIARWGIAEFTKRRFSAVLCKTTASAAYCNRLGLPNVKVCPVGIDSESYKGSTGREQLDWLRIIHEKHQVGKLILCYVGRLDKADNIPFLIQVLRNLPKDFELLLAGEPREYGLKIAKEAGVSNRVTFAGAVPNRLIGSVFECSVATLSCSLIEPFGLAATESLYHGCPVFAHPVGGLLDIVRDGQNGVHISLRTPQVWAKEISETLKNGSIPSFRSYISEIKHELTWSYRAIGYENVYKRALDMRRGGL